MLVGGCTPSSHSGGYPSQSWWVVPWVPPPSRPGQGVPWVSSHHPDLARGYLPPSGPGLGTPQHPDLARLPPIQTWLGYPLPSRPDWGSPHHPDLAGVPPHPDLAGVPPLPLRFGLTNQLRTVPFPILQMWVVARKPSCVNARGIPPTA